MPGKHLKFLRSQLTKAERKGDGNEQFQVLSQIGTELSSAGQYAEACHYHSEQLSLCDAFSLARIEKALAHRQLGECLVMLANYEEACEHHTLYLKLAQKHGTKKDEQEALTTIGRTAFLRADALFEEEEEAAVAAVATDWLLFAQQKFLESLDLCDQLTHEISEQQLLDMRSRLYLNLANVFARQGDRQPEVEAHLKKALLLAQSLASHEMELMVWINMADHYQKLFDFEKALAAGEHAALLAEKLDDRGRLVVAMEAIAQALLCSGEFASAKKYLKRAHQNQKESDEEKATLWKKLSQVVRLCQIHEQVNHLKKSKTSDSLERCCRLYEQLGDRCCKLKAYQQAVGFYKKQLKHCTVLAVEKSKVMVVLVSLAATYSDMKQHDKAVKYYEEEVSLRDAHEHKEISRTFGLIASAQLAGRFPEDAILSTLDKAHQHAEQASDLKLTVSALKGKIEAHEKFGRKAEAAKLKLQLEDTPAVLSSDSDASGNVSSAESSDVPMLESSESEEEAGRMLPKRQQQQLVNKMTKKNHRGETKLQEATISGNYKLVETLIQQGAAVNTSDHCGWTPLHEACNWGHTSLVQLLLENKAKVDDVANAADVTTPLHDAIRNGHLEIISLLLKHRANVSIANSKGETPLDMFVDVVTREEGDHRSTWPEDCRLVHKALLDMGAKHRPDYCPPKGSLPDASGTQRHAPTSPTAAPGGRQRRVRNNATTPATREPAARKRVDKGDGAETSKRMPASSARHSTTGQQMDGRRSGDRSATTAAQAPIVRTSEAPPLSDSSTSSLSDVDNAKCVSAVRQQAVLPGCAISQTRSVNVLSSDTESMDSDDPFYSVLSLSRPPTSQPSEQQLTPPPPLHRPLSSPMSQSPFPTMRSTADETVNSHQYGQPLRPRGIDFSSDSDGDSVVRQPPRPSHNRPRLPRRTSRQLPCSSATLVDEDEVVNVPGDDGWLIDDMGMDQTAARRHHSSHSGAKLTKTRSAPWTRAARTSRASHTSDPPLLDSDQEDRTEEPMDVSVFGSQADVSACTQTTNRTEAGGTTAGPGPLRLRVKVEQLVYLISCPSLLSSTSEPPTIAWLAGQAATRFLCSCGVTAKVELCTPDGALFDGNDAIAAVLSDNDVVHSRLFSSSSEPIQQRYANVCASSSTSCLPELQCTLTNAGTHPSKLCFRDLMLPVEHFKFVLQVLRGTSSLTQLDLSGNSLGDGGVTVLCQSLPFLTNLVHLDLSLNSLTIESVSEMAICVGGVSQGTHAPTSGAPLHCLKHLHLGFNTLSSSSSGILQPLLNRLDLSSLSLPATFVCPLVQPSLTEWFGRSQALAHLNLSHNSLSLPDLECLVYSLPSEALEDLNLSTCLSPSVPGCVGTLFATYLSKPTCALSALSLASCSLSNEDVKAIARHSSSLRELDLSSNLISWQAVDALKQLVGSHQLNVLSLSGNSMLGTSVCSALISAAVRRPPEAAALHLHQAACGVTSPLPQPVVSLSTASDVDGGGSEPLEPLLRSVPAAQHLAGIALLSLCHNDITQADKLSLAASWKRCQRQHVECLITGEICSLSVRSD